MRISERHVVQLIDGQDLNDDQLVFIDDASGAEITVPRDMWRRLQYAITYLTGDQQGVEQGTHQHFYEARPLDPRNTMKVAACSCGSVGGTNG